jgi:hypothetical protein
MAEICLRNLIKIINKYLSKIGSKKPVHCKRAEKEVLRAFGIHTEKPNSTSA